MKLGLVGLGKMGQQINARVHEAGHEVVVLDPSAEAVAGAVAAGAVAATDRADLVAQLGERPVVWLMIPAQAVVDELAAFLEVLPAGAVVIDGGNSDYRNTRHNAEAAQARSIELVDIGTSGGVHGITDGFSMMVGGSDAAVAQVTPIIEALAQTDGWRHFGSTGAGHFIKMVHNGIEYGVMEAYAEGYRLLNDTDQFADLDLGAIAKVWQHGSIIQSHLNQLAQEVLATNPTLEGVDGVVAESGEARWTLETAEQQQIELPVIKASLDVRAASQQGKISYATKLLAALRNAFGGHSINQK